MTKPDAHRRAIFFDEGRVTGYDASPADRSALEASRQDNLSTLQIGNERYEIRDAVINGG